MKDKPEIEQLISDFFALWQQECAAKLHETEVISGALHLIEAQLAQMDSSPQNKKASQQGDIHDISDDAVASIFRYLVAQLPERGTGAGADICRQDEMDGRAQGAGKTD